jgi:hypothetical protein
MATSIVSQERTNSLSLVTFHFNPETSFPSAVTFTLDTNSSKSKVARTPDVVAPLNAHLLVNVIPLRARTDAQAFTLTLDTS